MNSAADHRGGRAIRPLADFSIGNSRDSAKNRILMGRQFQKLHLGAANLDATPIASAWFATA